MSIYSSNIVKLGEQSELFLAEGIVVFFGDNAPEELQDVAVVHELKPVNGDIVVGTTIELSGEILKVTSNQSMILTINMICCTWAKF